MLVDAIVDDHQSPVAMIFVVTYPIVFYELRQNNWLPLTSVSPASAIFRAVSRSRLYSASVKLTRGLSTVLIFGIGGMMSITPSSRASIST